MENSGGRERDFTVDLESGGNTSEEERCKDSNSGVKQTNKLLGRIWSGFLSFDGSVKDREGVNACHGFPQSIGVSVETAGLLGEKKLVEGQQKLGLVEKKTGREKHKKGNKKPPRPPRPPRSPILDPADQKLVREISELAMLKRARLERIKALKKMRASKAASSSSSSSSLCALIITLLFCLIIILQGILSRCGSNLKPQVSPLSVEATREGLISVQYYRGASASSTPNSYSESPNVVEQASGLDRDEGRGAAG